MWSWRCGQPESSGPAPGCLAGPDESSLSWPAVHFEVQPWVSCTCTAGAGVGPAAARAGALVVGRDAGGQQFLADRKPFSRVDVKSDGDGHFLLWDLSYNGGPVTVTAQYGGQTRTATAYEVDPASTHSDLRGRFSQTSATIVFPATEPPPPPPAARVRLFKLLANDQRQEILNGLVPEDEPVLIGVTPERPAGLPPGDPLPYDVGTQGVEIQGTNQGLQVERDPLGQTSPNHALANRWLVKDTTRADGLFVPAWGVNAASASPTCC